MHIERLDHLVLTVADIDRTCEFYTRVLGMEVVRFGEGRTALRFGQQKINLHPAGNIPGLVADKPTPGSADLCFITPVPLADVTAHLESCGVSIVAGPMQVSAAAAVDAGGGDRFDERENRALGRAYLARMFRRYRAWPDAIAAYNWGPGHLDGWINGGRAADKFPATVERYRNRVLVYSALAVGGGGGVLFSRVLNSP